MRPVPLVGYVPRLILVLADDDHLPPADLLVVTGGNLLNVLHRVQGLDHAGSDGRRRWQPVDQLLGRRTGRRVLVRLPRDHRRRLVHVPIRGRHGRGRVVVNLRNQSFNENYYVNVNEREGCTG